MLVVIVARGGHVIQKVIEVAEPLDADDLREAANYLNAEFSGLPLYRAREAVLERISEERLLYDALLARAMRLATSTFADLPGGGTIYVDGAASLLEETHGLTLGTLQTLLQMIEEKQRLVRLLNEYIDGPGLTVVIGAEHLDPNLRSFSLIVVDLRRRRWRSARSASSARRACAIRAPSTSWTAPRRPSRAFCAIPTRTL